MAEVPPGVAPVRANPARKPGDGGPQEAHKDSVAEEVAPTPPLTPDQK